MVELALILPALLLIVLAGLDFGRIYLGWINLQQMARVAANYAADHASGWPDDVVVQAAYDRLVESEASLNNCDLEKPGGAVPPPTFAVATNPKPTGSSVTVQFDCDFTVLTPIISWVLGDSVTASASSVFPVKEGIVVAAQPGGGGTTLPPVADFIGSPQSGWAPLTVAITDTSQNLPGFWTWDFSLNPTATGSASGSATPPSSNVKDPGSVIYDCTGDPGDVCTFGVSLRVQNSAGSDTDTRDGYMTVTVPPASGPIAEFDGNPRTGTEDLAVNFQYVDAGGSPPVKFEWTFGDGATGTGQTTSHTYTDAGSYDVTLKVTDATDATSQLKKTGFIVVDRHICTVPDFAGLTVPQARTLWVQNGFVGSNLFPANGGFTIRSQSLPGGQIDPQPLGCDSVITVKANP